MGQTTHLSPRSFASHLNRYLWSVISVRGAERSGRWLEVQTGGARKKDYWKKITDNRQAMTTNDIHVIADMLGISPYQFVRDAREWDDGESAKPTTTVPPSPSDDLAARRLAKSAPKPRLRKVAKPRSTDRGGDNGQG